MRVLDHNGIYGDRPGVVDSAGWGQGSVTGCCEYGDEPSGSGAMEVVI
jgi:hypothetical protein